MTGGQVVHPQINTCDISAPPLSVETTSTEANRSQ